MKPDSLKPSENANVLNTHKFEHRKGYFIIEADPIMTENQVVSIEHEYQLVEFGSAGKIDLRTVIFWFASLKQNVLKITCYDLDKKIVITKIHDFDTPENYSDWFLISNDFFGDELLEFCFESKPEKNENKINIPDVCNSDPRDSFYLDRSFILTKHKNLVTGMPYMYSEGNRTAAVRLVKTWVEDNIIYLDVEELNSLKTFTLSWNLSYDGQYWLWSLADFQTLMNLT